MLWLTADWHLGEDRFKIMQRPFKSAEEHVECLIERHNSLVKPYDTVIVIGDAVYQKTPEYVKHIERFNGCKTLIRGNHDRVIDNDTYLKYFDNIIEDGGCVLLNISGIPCRLTHYPSQGREDTFNLVGHIHSAWKYQLNMFNVGVDVNNYYPVSADDIPFHYDAICQFYDDDVWIAYSNVNQNFRGKRGKPGSYFREKHFTMKKIEHQEGLTYTIYNKPRDFPREVVIRAWCGTDSAGIKARCATIEEARALIPDGLKRIPADDDSVIVESWE